MWYFAWILGVGLAASFAILNGMWYELRDNDRQNSKHDHDSAGD